MATIAQEGNSLTPDALVELFEFDTTPIIDTPTGNDILFYTNSNVGDSNGILWNGDLYKPFPFKFTGVIKKADGTAPARPTVTVSNVNEVFYAAFLSLGNLDGCRVVRHKTFFKFTDEGGEPNLLSEFPIEEYTIIRKIKKTPLSIDYELGTSTDQPMLRLPRRIITRDKTANNLHAPGVSRTRLRS